jgi:hypothetical protein
MHPQLACGAALIASVFRKHRRDKALLEFSYGFGIKNIAAVHLLNERFQLIFHGESRFPFLADATYG